MTDKNDKEEKQKIAKEKQENADKIKTKIENLLNQGKSGFSLDIYEEIKKDLRNIGNDETSEEKNEQEHLEDRVINKCKPDDEIYIFMKVCVIDRLYSTHLKKYEVFPISKFINDNITEIDEIITSDNETEIPDKIQTLLDKEDGKHHISFISKYLTTHQYFLHNKQHIQICDNIVCKTLQKFSENTFYKKIIDDYKTKNNLTITYKQCFEFGNYKNIWDKIYKQRCEYINYKVWYEIIGKILEAIWDEDDNDLNRGNFGRRDFDWYIWYVYRDWNNKNTKEEKENKK